MSFEQIMLRQLDRNVHKQKQDSHLSPYAKISLKRIKDLTLHEEIIKLFAGIIGSAPENAGTSNGFLGKSPNAQAVKAKINKWEPQETKNLLCSEENDQPSYEATNRIQENLCILQNQQGTNNQDLRRASGTQGELNKQPCEEMADINEQILQKSKCLARLIDTGKSTPASQLLRKSTLKPHLIR